jgi:hypothetical protein
LTSNRRQQLFRRLISATWAVGALCLLAPLARAGMPQTCLARPVEMAFLAPEPVRLDAAPALVVGDGEPELRFAQRAITPDMGVPRQTDATEYAYVDIPGWKSPGQSAGMSLALPGSGQLYNGSSRGYVYLGIEALAVYTFAHFKAQRDDARDDYFAYVGDPNSSSSRFSFERLEGSVDPTEIARLREIYAKDQREFYDAVTNDEDLVAGWSATADRGDAQFLAKETDRLARRSRFGMFVGIANHLISAVDALHLARLNNIALRDDLSLKIKVRPSLGHSSLAFTLTQKFR